MRWGGAEDAERERGKQRETEKGEGTGRERRRLASALSPPPPPAFLSPWKARFGVGPPGLGSRGPLPHIWEGTVWDSPARGRFPASSGLGSQLSTPWQGWLHHGRGGLPPAHPAVCVTEHSTCTKRCDRSHGRKCTSCLQHVPAREGLSPDTADTFHMLAPRRTLSFTGLLMHLHICSSDSSHNPLKQVLLSLFYT